MQFFSDSYAQGEDGVWALPNWDESARLYSEHLEKILVHLPVSAQQLIDYMRSNSFHDWTIGKWGHDGDARTAFLEFHFPCGRLEFEGVKSIDVPFRDDGSAWPWIVEEFDLSDDGAFVLRVFVEDGEIRVVADGVRMSGLPMCDS